MALVRWSDPLRGLSTVHRSLDDLLSGFLNDTVPLRDDRDNRFPTMDVYIENDNQLVAELHLPRFSSDDVEIRVQDNTLEIRGERQESAEDKDRRKRGYLIRQSVERFYRRIALPQNADLDNIQASFEGGLLRITVPFTKEQEGRSITIGAGSGSVRSSGKSLGQGNNKEKEGSAGS